MSKFRRVPGAVLAALVVAAGCSEIDPPTVFENPDVTPPAAIDDLRVLNSSAGDSSITFIWTAVGDDGRVGRVLGHELRWSDDGTTDFDDPTAPGVGVVPFDGLFTNAGSPLEATVAGLPGLDPIYTFRMFSFDETYGTPEQPARGLSPASNLVIARIASTPSTGGIVEDFEVASAWRAVVPADTVALDFRSGFGSDGGHARGSFASPWYFSSFAATNGPIDASDLYGGALRCDLIVRDGAPRATMPALFRLVGATAAIEWDADLPARREWFHVAVDVDDASGWRRSQDGLAATRTDVEAILAELVAVEVRGDLAEGAVASSGLDRVRLGRPVPFVSLPVLSPLDDSGHDWTVAGAGLIVDRRPDFVQDGGVSGGYVTIDTTPTSYWIAPTDFRGDLSAARGDTLRFSAFTSADPPRGAVDEMVVLEGAGRRLVWRSDVAPASTWTSFEVPLRADEGWRDAVTGSTIDDGTLDAVLGALGLLKIRAHYPGVTLGTTTQRNGLDAVSILRR